MAIEITKKDKRNFKAAIKKIQIMREIHAGEFMAFIDPVNLYAFIRCMEHIGELLNPNINRTPLSIFQNVSQQIPLQRTADIRNSLGHSYHQNFTNHIPRLQNVMPYYNLLEQHLQLLVDNKELDADLLKKLKNITYPGQKSTFADEAFASELYKTIRSGELSSLDHKARLHCFIKVLTDLQTILNSPDQENQMRKLLAIQRCLQIIGQIVREITKSKDESITNYFFKNKQTAQLRIWNGLRDTRDGIAHLPASKEIDEQFLLHQAQEVLSLKEGLEYISLPLEDKQKELCSKIDAEISEIEALSAKISEKLQDQKIDSLLSASESDFDELKANIEKLSHFPTIIDSLLESIGTLNAETILPSSSLSHLSPSSSSSSTPNTDPSSFIRSLFEKKQEIETVIKEYQQKIEEISKKREENKLSKESVGLEELDNKDSEKFQKITEEEALQKQETTRKRPFMLNTPTGDPKWSDEKYSDSSHSTSAMCIPVY